MTLLVVVGGVVALLVLWWWITKPPSDHRDSVSQKWQDEHSRERRD